MVAREGSRPLLLEVQALVDGSYGGNPRRVAVGLDQGRLIRPIAESLKTEFGYYLLCRDNLQQDRIVNHFRNWLLRLFGAGEIPH